MAVDLPKVTFNNAIIAIAPERKTKSGIFMPEEIADINYSFAGEVLVVGKECEYVKVGNYAFFRAGVGRMIEDDRFGKEFKYIVVCEDDIVAYYDKPRTDD